jgi:NAD(P)-dependent dehydrogenase (short-subunit alcohol dehydrogenase family)
MARRAIVTGSDSGIGEATAVALAKRGFRVGITWHEDRKGAEEAASKIEARGGAAEIAEMDLADLPRAADAVDELAARLGGVDVFVNNAGTSRMAPFLDLEFDDWRHTLDVDLCGAFLCAQRAARHMARAGGGRIVNITSVHEHVPLEKSAAYCAAKGGLGMLTKVMALELAEHGITVNSIAPGEIATAMTGAEDADPKTIARQGIPVGRPGDANEIAEAVAFLASDEAAYITGTSLVVDGGLMLMAAVQNQ